MRVLAWSPNLTPERAAAAGVEFAPTKEELLRQADLFSVHLVLAPSTRHLIGAAELALLKPTAFLFNTSRGPIIEENALIEVLSARKIAGAGLDVYDIEPLPLDHPLRKVPNVTLSPHNAYVSEDQYEVGPMSFGNLASSKYVVYKALVGRDGQERHKFCGRKRSQSTIGFNTNNLATRL
jgi:phosphoglycerate dehydrogenase-like enzyme